MTKFEVVDSELFRKGCVALISAGLIITLVSIIPAKAQHWFGMTLPTNMQDTSTLVTIGYIIAIIGLIIGILSIAFSLNIEALLEKEEKKQ